MGNCQAVDNAAILIQHPDGKTHKLFFPLPASEVMRTNPGHYVALLLTTTTVYSVAAPPPENKNTTAPLRITRIKLLRPADTLALGHVYRLVTTQEVMKGLWAKKQQRQKHKQSSDMETELGKTTQVNNQERQISRSKKPASSSASKYRGTWQPALKSISESAT